MPSLTSGDEGVERQFSVASGGDGAGVGTAGGYSGGSDEAL